MQSFLSWGGGGGGEVGERYIKGDVQMEIGSQPRVLPTKLPSNPPPPLRKCLPPLPSQNVAKMSFSTLPYGWIVEKKSCTHMRKWGLIEIQDGGFKMAIICRH